MPGSDSRNPEDGDSRFPCPSLIPSLGRPYRVSGFSQTYHAQIPPFFPGPGPFFARPLWPLFLGSAWYTVNTFHCSEYSLLICHPFPG